MKNPDKINLWVLVPLAVMLAFVYMVIAAFLGRVP